MKQCAAVVLSFILLTFGVGSSLATDVSGTISTDTTWSVVGSPYVIPADTPLTINSGATLTIESGVLVDVSYRARVIVNGTLNATGVSFVGNNGTSAAYEYLSYISGSSGSLSGCTVSNLRVVINSSNVAISTGGIGNSASNYGIYIGSAAAPSITGVEFSGEYPIQLNGTLGGSLSARVQGNTYESGATVLYSGTVSANSTLPIIDGLPYAIPVDTPLAINSGATLTIATGAMIDVLYRARVIVSGTLDATGVSLVGKNGTSATYEYLSYASGSSGLLSGCTVDNLRIVINSSSVSVRNSTIGNAGAPGVTVGNNAHPTIVSNSFVGNDFGAVVNQTTTMVLAEGNYWGHASGPTHTSNPSGQGDSVSDYVDFTPWVTSISSHIYHPPYYNQGKTDWCVYTCLAMLLSCTDGNAMQPWEVAADFGVTPSEGYPGSEEDFPLSLASDIVTKYALSPGIIPGKTCSGAQARADIELCFQSGTSPIIMNFGYTGPTNSPKHAVLVTGHDGQRVYISDPSGDFFAKVLNYEFSTGLPDISGNNLSSRPVDWTDFISAIDAAADWKCGFVYLNETCDISKTASLTLFADRQADARSTLTLESDGGADNDLFLYRDPAGGLKWGLAVGSGSKLDLSAAIGVADCVTDNAALDVQLRIGFGAGEVSKAVNIPDQRCKLVYFDSNLAIPDEADSVTIRLLSQSGATVYDELTIALDRSNPARSPQWSDATTLKYGPSGFPDTYISEFPADDYGMCRVGNLLGSDFGGGRQTLAYNALTVGQSATAGMDVPHHGGLFLWSDRTGTDQVHSFASVNADWSTPGQVTIDADGNNDLYRYFTFGTNALPGVTETITNYIVLVHGWNPDGRSDKYSGGAFEELETALSTWLVANGKDDEWKLLKYHMEADTDTGDALDWNTNPGAAATHASRSAEIARIHGYNLAEVLLERCPDAQQVHLIAHSAGSWAARSAVRGLLAESTQVEVQMTLLDAYVPTENNWLTADDSSLGVPQMNSIKDVSGNDRIFVLDNYYVSGSDLGTQEAFDWGTHELPSTNVNLDDRYSGDPKYDDHDGPIYYYADTVNAPLNTDHADHGWAKSIAYQGTAAPVGTMSPAGNAVVETHTPTFTWTTVPGATWYYVWCFRNGSSYCKRWVRNTERPWTINTSLPAGNYTWWVRSCNTTTWLTDWQGASSFSIPDMTPAEVSLLTPQGSQLTDTPAFSWSPDPAGYATHYQLYLKKDSERYHLGVVDGATTYTHPSSLHLGEYEWWVRGWSQDGWGPWSLPGGLFQLGKVQHASPSSGSLVADHTPQLSWNMCSFADYYYVVIYKGGTKIASKWVAGSANTTWDCPVTLSGGSTYSWWVRTWNTSGYGLWSDGGTFTIESAVPGTISLVSPVSGIQSPGNVSYRWSGDSRASWYHLYVLKDGSGWIDEWIERSAADGQTITSTWTNHRDGSSYEWWIQPWGPDGLGLSWSAKGSFQVLNQLPMVTGVTAVGLTDYVRINCDSVSGATHYRFYRGTSSTGPWSAISGWQTSRTYDDYSVAPDVQYWFTVRAASSSSGDHASPLP